MILDKYRILKYNLPSKVEGTYLIPYKLKNSTLNHTITIEAESNKWKIKSNGSVDNTFPKRRTYSKK